MWNCVCDCSGTKTANSYSLKTGKIKSCGCLHVESITRHGLSRSPEYRAWGKMKDRCLNESCKAYKDYGGRGIKISSDWMSFEKFFSDIGKRPSSQFSIERIDNNKGYSRENCRWATKLAQMNNTRRNVTVRYNGSDYTVAQLSRETGVNRNTLDYRIFKLGMTAEQAVSQVKYGALRDFHQEKISEKLNG